MTGVSSNIDHYPNGTDNETTSDYTSEYKSFESFLGEVVYRNFDEFGLSELTSLLLSVSVQAKRYTVHAPGEVMGKYKYWLYSPRYLIAVNPLTNEPVELPNGTSLNVILQKITTTGGSKDTGSGSRNPPTVELMGPYTFIIEKGSSFAELPHEIKDEIEFKNSESDFLSENYRVRAIQIYSDINNDGELNSEDSGLTQKAYLSSTEQDKGTEFMFADDDLSNGAWDQGDEDAPSGSDDDDAEEIHLEIGPLEPDYRVWLEHPAMAGLKFYRDKACTDEFQISSSQPFVIGGPINWLTDNKVYIRAENVEFPTADPQIEGDLKLMIRPPGTSSSSALAAKMKLMVIKSIGATKYFHGARDYIFENNTKTFTHHKEYGSTRYRIVAMREESTVMFGLDTYDHVGDKPSLKGIDAVKANFNSDVIINGNQCYSNNGIPFTDYPYSGGMTNRCDGRLCVGTQILRPPSDDTHNPNLGGPGARYVGYTMGEPEMVNGQVIIPSLFTFATGQVPEGVTATPDHGLGGLAAKYDRDELQQSENQAIGRATVTEPGKGIVFTATTYVGQAGNAISLAADAHNSGVPPLSGGAAGAWELLFLDGSSSVGLVLSNPNGDQQTVIKGGKHTGSPYYYINTYLLFECEKPRN